jgi:hypothetical protein
MKRNTFCHFLLSISTILFLTGCAGSAYLNTSKQPPQTIYDHNELLLLVVGNGQTIANPEFAEIRDQFEKILVNELRNKPGFEKISIVNRNYIEQGQLLMVVTINYIHSVSTAARLAAGAFAGAASFKTSVELYENSRDNRISEAICGTSSSKSQGIFAASTSQQLELVAKRIAQEFTP